MAPVQKRKPVPTTKSRKRTTFDPAADCPATASSALVRSIGAVNQNDLPPRYQEKVECRMNLFTKFLEKNRLTKHPHQEFGVRWCLNHELHPEPPFEVRGGFIADEMGLGKTIVMLGIAECNVKRRTLIVVPNILVKQWHQLLLRTCSRLPLSVVYTAETRATVQLSALVVARVVITTYTMLGDAMLQSLAWNRVIFDEAHYLRNASTKRHKCAKSLKAEIRWLVSGTPINNHMADYYSLASILGLPPPAYLDQQMVLRRYVLRRTKQSVGLRLPPLIFHDTPVQCDNDQEQFLHDFVHAGLPFSNIEPDLNKFKPEDHPFSEKASHYSRIQLLGKARQMSSYMPFTESKLRMVLAHVITNCRMFPAAKHILFCTYHAEIDFVESQLQLEQIECSIVDGRHPMPEHLKGVLILQINSCCEGLNLQQYSHLYFVMPHWNPAVEMQAIARAHRIGQMQTVNVHRFYFAADTRTKSTTQVASNSLEAFLSMQPGATVVADDEPQTIDQYVRTMQRKKCLLHFMDARVHKG